MDTNRYWIAQGRSLELYRAWQAAAAAYNAAMLDLAERLTGDRYYYRQGLPAVSFRAPAGADPTRPPVGLRLDKKARDWRPNLRVKAGREIDEAMALPSAVSPRRLRHALWGDQGTFVGTSLVLHEGGAEDLPDGTVVLIHHEKVTVDPPDAEPITRARYYEMRDAPKTAATPQEETHV
jgi:hypothetical protein